jgi:hypothetical protein
MTKTEQTRRFDRLNRLMDALIAGRAKGKLYRMMSKKNAATISAPVAAT